MDRRQFVRLLLGAPAVKALPKQPEAPPPPEPGPMHDCVEHPSLPCPACLKWTGDGYATVRANPQMFPRIKVP